MKEEKQNKDIFEKRNKVSRKDTQDDTLIDEFKDQKFVDDIPVEELNIKVKQEKNKRKSQNESQSEEKH